MITVATVAHATEAELICLTYERFLETIEEAMQEEGSTKKHKLEKAREILVVLTENLDLENTIAKQLFQLYTYIQGALIRGYKDNESLKEAHQLVELIHTGYKEVHAQLASQPVQATSIQNAQNVYAGMTYGKGCLNEVTLEEKDRGYRA